MLSARFVVLTVEVQFLHIEDLDQVLTMSARAPFTMEWLSNLTHTLLGMWLLIHAGSSYFG